MKKLILVLLLVIGIAVSPTVAKAANVFTMTPYQLGQLYETYENPASAGTYLSSNTYYPGIGAKYDGKVRNQETGWGSIQIGANFWGYAYGDTNFPGSSSTGPGTRPRVGTLGLGSLGGYDKYALAITNLNENPWMYNLYFNVGYTDPGYGETNYFVQNTWTTIPRLGTQIVTLDFTNAQVYGGAYAGQWVNLSTISGLNLAHISNIGFNIGANLPLPGHPVKDYTFETAVTPIPEPTSMMLLGMGILGVFGLRRKKA